MSKPIRLLTAMLVSLLLGGMFAYQDAQKNAPTYQQHPVTVIVTDFFCGSLSGLIVYFGSGWLYRRKEKKLEKAEDDKFYDEVARELQDKPMSPGLWTKAFAETGSDDAKARALYIKYRVAQLATTANQEQSVKQAQVSKAKKQQVISAFRRYAYLTTGWILTLFGCLFFVLGIAMVYSHFYPSSHSDRVEGLAASGIFFVVIACAFASLGFLAFAKAGIKFTLR